MRYYLQLHKRHVVLLRSSLVAADLSGMEPAAARTKFIKLLNGQVLTPMSVYVNALGTAWYQEVFVNKQKQDSDEVKNNLCVAIITAI